MINHKNIKINGFSILGLFKKGLKFMGGLSKNTQKIFNYKK